MASPEDAQRALRTIVHLSEEYGSALDTAFRVLGDGALTGRGADELYSGMVQRHTTVRRSLATAFQQVRQIASSGGPPSPPLPPPQTAPVPATPPTARDGFVGGDPDRLNALSRELASAGRRWQEAGAALAALLSRLGLAPSPGRDIGRAGEWIASQTTEVNRRRDKLVRKEPQPGAPTAGAAGLFGTTAGSGSHSAEKASYSTDLARNFGDGEFTAPGEPDHVIDWIGDRVTETVADGADALGLGLAGDAVRFLDDNVATPISRPFVKGAVEGTIDLGTSLWNFSLIRAATDLKGFSASVTGLKDGLVYGAQHPVEFAGAVADWDTLTTDPVRWFGKLVPDAIIAATTAGGGAAAAGAGRASKGLGALDKLSDLTRGAQRGLREPYSGEGLGRTGTATGRGEGTWAKPGPSDTMGTRREHTARNDPLSTEPAAPKTPGDGALPSGDPVYYRSGATAVGYDTTTMKNFNLVAPEAGYHDVVVHGKPEGYFKPGRMNAFGAEFSGGDTHPSHIADAIRNNPTYKGEPIRLISCHSGTVHSTSVEIPAAQELANTLGVPVMAPTDRVGINGRINSLQNPRIDKDGYWRLFLPITQ